MTPTRVLFLCTGNSARSILAAAMLNHLGQGRFTAYSAGSQPAGRIHPGALRELARQGIDADGLRSKSWDEFTAPDAPAIDLVVTVCDSAAAEPCPAFFGDFARIHWGLPDPAHVAGNEAVVDEAFRRTAAVIRDRLQAVVALPAGLPRAELQQAVHAIESRFPAQPLAGANA